MSLLKVDNLKMSAEEKNLLDGLSFEINEKHKTSVFIVVDILYKISESYFKIFKNLDPSLENQTEKPPAFGERIFVALIPGWEVITLHLSFNNSLK